MAVGLDTWVSIAALLGTGATLASITLHSARRLDQKIDRVEGGLRSEIGELRAELKGDIAELRAELKADVARVDSRLYDLATGRQVPLIVSGR